MWVFLSISLQINEKQHFWTKIPYNGKIMRNILMIFDDNLHIWNNLGDFSYFTRTPQNSTIWSLKRIYGWNIVLFFDDFRIKTAYKDISRLFLVPPSVAHDIITQHLDRCCFTSHLTTHHRQQTLSTSDLPWITCHLVDQHKHKYN